MKLLKFFLILLVLVLLIAGGYYLFASPDVYVERSTVIEASPKMVYNEVIDLKTWGEWDPWSLMDPDMTVEYEGPDSKVGMIRKWKSDNSDVGVGEMELMYVEPVDSALFQLRFGEMTPGDIGWSFEEVEEGTKVTWTMATTMDGAWKLIKPMMVSQLGKNYEDGLANLKDRVEALPEAPEVVIDQVTLETTWYLSITDSCPSSAIAQKLEQHWVAMITYLEQTSAQMAGTPVAFYHSYDPEGMTHLDVAIPISDSITIEDGMELKKVEGPALMSVYFGDYYGTTSTYDAMEAYMEDNGLEPTGSPWEAYITDPVTEPDTAKWETHIYFPL